MVDFGVRWAFLPVKTQSDKNVQPTFKDKNNSGNESLHSCLLNPP